MGRVLATFWFLCGLVCANASAGVIARFTREGASGVPGVRHAIRLPLGVCGGGPAGCEGESAVELFGLLSLGPANVGRSVKADGSAEEEMDQVLAQLRDGQEDMMRFRASLVRISGGAAEGDSVSLAESEAFFPTHPTFVDFSEFVIEEIHMTLEGLTLSSPGSDENGDGQWTDYSYRVTYTVIGYPVARVDCRGDVDPDPPNPDGRTTLADWNYLRTHATPPNRCLRGPTVPLPLGCECGNADANVMNEFDMDLRDVAIFQNSFHPR